MQNAMSDVGALEIAGLRDKTAADSRYSRL